MSHLQDRPLMSLTLPGTHNSGTYQPHNFLWVIKNYMLCQDKSVYEQLKMGVRVLDIRGSKYYAPNQRNIHVANYLKHGEPEQNDNNQKRKKMFRYYIGHTLICVPLDQVIFDIQKFIYKNPTEVIIVLLRTDFAVFNADFKYLSHNSQQNRSRVKKIKNKEMSDFIDYFINGVGRDKFMLHDFTYSTKIRKITSQNKNIVLFVDGKLYPKSTIENKCSWSDTIHHKPRINISLYLSLRPTKPSSPPHSLPQRATRPIPTAGELSSVALIQGTNEIFQPAHCASDTGEAQQISVGQRGHYQHRWRIEEARAEQQQTAGGVAYS
eukprot:403363747